MRIELGQAGVDVAPQVGDSQIGTGVQQLSPPAQAAGPDDGAMGNIAPAKGGPADQSISRIFPRAYGRNCDALGQLSGEVLERMNRKVDSPFQQCVVNLLGENRASPDPGERYLGHQITRGLDLKDHGLMAGRAK
jgi:hypothetical protein